MSEETLQRQIDEIKSDLKVVVSTITDLKVAMAEAHGGGSMVYKALVLIGPVVAVIVASHLS